MISTADAVPESSALRTPGYRTFLLTFMLAMMADNIEHVISYWVVFQKFHSAALGGFAVVSHWLPFLMFSVPVGALNDRFDSRRLIQCGMVLFIIASVGWGYFFVTDSLQVWHAMVLLTIHGCAGVLWGTSSQMLLYDIVGARSLPSAVRLNATARYLGVLVGPGVGSLIMRTLGPTWGIFVNTVFYLPLLLWLVRAPYGRHFRGVAAGPKRAVRGLADIIQTVRDVREVPVVGAMVLLAGTASFFIGNSYHAQMPGFAQDLGHGDPGATYTLLLGADAAGALLAGILLETRGSWLRTEPASALKMALLWGCALFAFSLVRVYPVAIFVLFLAGFFELSFSSMTQALVQLNAPDTIRGRVLGLFTMSASGLRAFSGVTVGLLGSVTNIHLSLAVSALAFVTVAGLLLLRRSPQGA
ncbi:MFS transporter [Archangium violaceum]|uniref:MFS transporter n=1 Tax=Archangium violaceum TaxID=83451 RepID=UPI00193BE5F8|nr:MFS transporter [Archangium violaceum]QRK09916.1 MFS transporter [Archangium violaceum]